MLAVHTVGPERLTEFAQRASGVEGQIWDLEKCWCSLFPRVLKGNEVRQKQNSNKENKTKTTLSSPGTAYGHSSLTESSVVPQRLHPESKAFSLAHASFTRPPSSCVTYPIISQNTRFIASCYAVSSWHHWEACSFLKRNGRS